MVGLSRLSMPIGHQAKIQKRINTMFATPWAFLALAAVPIAVGIYLFRMRPRRRVVSALFLWVDRQQMQQGGQRIQSPQLPLILLLEIIALSLLAIAAARPMLRIEAKSPPTAI